MIIDDTVFIIQSLLHRFTTLLRFNQLFIYFFCVFYNQEISHNYS